MPPCTQKEWQVNVIRNPLNEWGVTKTVKNPPQSPTTTCKHKRDSISGKEMMTLIKGVKAKKKKMKRKN